MAATKYVSNCFNQRAHLCGALGSSNAKASGGLTNSILLLCLGSVTSLSPCYKVWQHKNACSHITEIQTETIIRIYKYISKHNCNIPNCSTQKPTSYPDWKNSVCLRIRSLLRNGITAGGDTASAPAFVRGVPACPVTTAGSHFLSCLEYNLTV